MVLPDLDLNWHYEFGEIWERRRFMADTLFIGIDGGGTQCRARIRDGAGRLLGEGTGGPANLRLGPQVAMGSIVAAAKAAATAGGLNDSDLTRAAVGLGRNRHGYIAAVIGSGDYAARTIFGLDAHTDILHGSDCGVPRPVKAARCRH